MKIYVAASFPRQSTDALTLALMLESAGHTVTSRWIRAETHLAADGYSDAAGKDQAHAMADVSDVLEAEAIVSITGDRESRGGRHTEFGIGYALGKRLILHGPREQIFHHLPGVVLAATHADVLEALAATPAQDAGKGAT